MPDNQTTIPLGQATIRKDGLFDLEKLYKIPTDWATSKGYNRLEKENAKKYAADGGEYTVAWNFRKKVDDYVRYDVDIELWVYKGLEVLVEQKGQQLKRVKGKIDIKIKLSMTTNYEGAFKLSKPQQFIRKFLEKYIWKNRLENLGGAGNIEFLDLQAKMKQGLEQYT
ncbi:MAG: hypothetical protein Q7R56_00690 [Nanoarchaeota archaeon]|nr:hypothetical protein [Nanoarchaeota archaeon]